VKLGASEFAVKELVTESIGTDLWNGGYICTFFTNQRPLKFDLDAC
jgi:hypothetical protein